MSIRRSAAVAAAVVAAGGGGIWYALQATPVEYGLPVRYESREVYVPEHYHASFGGGVRPMRPQALHREYRYVDLDPVPGDLTGDRRVDLDDLLIALSSDDLDRVLLVQGNFGADDPYVWLSGKRAVAGQWVRINGEERVVRP